MAQFAQEFSGALGRTIQYVNVPPRIWEAKLRERKRDKQARKEARKQAAAAGGPPSPDDPPA